MRLRTAESYWLIKNGLLFSYSSLDKNLSADVVVVGAGITGALMSHALLEEGLKVIVIDKGDVAFGSTSATTSMLQYEVDLSLTELTEKIGFEGASLCYQAGVTAIHDLSTLIKKTKIECGFENKDSLLIAHDKKSGKKLKDEFELREVAGLPVKWLSSTEIKKTFNLKSYGGILSTIAGSIDAYKLAHELLQKNTKRAKNPLQVFDQTEIKHVTETARSVTVECENGHAIKCKDIVYCTGFQATQMLKEKVATLFDTYAVISEQKMQLKEAMFKTLVWDTASPYHYMRTTEDGRFLVGGEDSQLRMGLLREKLKERKSKKLINYLEDVSPGIKFVEDFTWAGTFGQTKDGLPYIGKSPEFKRSYFVLGFGGNGITYSVQAMKLLPALMRGEETELGEFYRFGR